MKLLMTASLLALFVNAAHGQSSPAPDPSNSATHIASYTSAFSAYVPWGDTAVVAWPESNELVQRRGGWRAYAREAAQERRRIRERKALLKESGASK